MGTADDLKDFERFIKQREGASQAFVNGDVGPLEALATPVSPATIFGPKGSYVVGADQVNAANSNDAKHFQKGSESHFEILHMAAGQGVAFWAGIQRTVVRMKGKAEPIPMNLRVTEAFRREQGEWKLVHRHADPLKLDDQ
jgi:ketosteroid isomerase-like protein